MAVIPVLHQDQGLREAIRRGVRHHPIRVLRCRNLERLHQLLGERLVDAIVLDVRRGAVTWALDLADRYPRIPVFACGAFRPDDGVLLRTCLEGGLRILVMGMDDAVAGEHVAAHSAGAVRRLALRDAPARLRLAEPLQLQVWSAILDRVDGPTPTDRLAKDLGYSREHLSREFAAGGAPNLKRVIDLARLACAADVLGNPGYTVGNVARILGFSSSSHLAGSARRIADASPSELGGLGARGVLARFSEGRTRSRL